MLRAKTHNHSDEDVGLLDPSSGEEEYRHSRSPRDAPGINVVNNTRSANNPSKVGGAATAAAAAEAGHNTMPYTYNQSTHPYGQPADQYNQPYGYAHPYHPPPQYNTPPPPPYHAHRGGGLINCSGGIHYSYLILIALGFATVVQISKGGLFAYNANQRPQFVYPVPVQNNLRFPNGGAGGFNNYYMGNGNMMAMNGMNGQQAQAQQEAAPGAESDPVAATSDSSASTESSTPVPEEPSSSSSSSAGESGGNFDLEALSNFKDNWYEGFQFCLFLLLLNKFK